MAHEFTFRANVWLFEGGAAWYFVTLPKSVSTQIKALLGSSRKAFGTVKVMAMIGETRWKTSIFPDKKHSSYVLPIKSLVRQREHLPEGVEVEVSLSIEGVA